MNCYLTTKKSLLFLVLLLIGHLQALPTEIFSVNQFHQPLCTSNSLVTAINDFAFQMVKEFGEDDNIFISPFSIYAALAMTYLGANGRTAEQIETALNIRKYNLNSAQLHEAFKEYLLLLEQSNDQYRLLVANGLIVQQDFLIKEEYINNMTQIYGADVKTVDFIRNGQDAVRQINNWVSEKTQSKIEKLYNGPLNPMTSLVLLNAIYFKGTWQIEFPKERTYEGRFYNNGRFTTVTMMNLHEETFRFYEDSLTSYKFVELPYQGNHVSMLLALPLDFDSPANLEMTPEILCRVNNSMVPTELENLVIPKFHIEYETELKTVLRALGMTDLFTPSADLAGIRDERDLYVSAAKHKAVIDVNEEGSEAAAITVLEFVRYSASFKPNFYANHPFMFYIIDNRQGTILFAGRVTNPE